MSYIMLCTYFKITDKSFSFHKKHARVLVLSSLRPGCELLGYDMLVTVISLETLTDSFRKPADMSQSHDSMITITCLFARW